MSSGYPTDVVADRHEIHFGNEHDEFGVFDVGCSQQPVANLPVFGGVEDPELDPVDFGAEIAEVVAGSLVDGGLHGLHPGPEDTEGLGEGGPVVEGEDAEDGQLAGQVTSVGWCR